MLSKLKQELAKTGLFHEIMWVKFTNNIGLTGAFSNPSSPKNKQQFIRKTAKKNKLMTFVETGTYLGDMIFENLNNFENIYSIELDKRLYERAKKRFANNQNVKILNGDSAEILKTLVPKLKEKALFWLDAHYSGGITSKTERSTPIQKELDIIFHNWRTGTVIAIDDARLFVGTNDYPKIKEIYQTAKKFNLKTSVTKDIILIK